MKTHRQTEFIDYLVNVVERLAATEADISFRSWWRTNLELKQFWTQCFCCSVTVGHVFTTSLLHTF